MNNFLQDVQYRDLRPGFKLTDDSAYGAWKDIEGNPSEMRFAPTTQLRMKPLYIFTLIDGETAREFRTKDLAMSHMAKLLDEGKTVQISPHEKEQDFFTEMHNRNIQWRAVTVDTKIINTQRDTWNPIRTVSTAKSLVQFRVRPDHYYQVTTADTLISAVIEFDDADNLLAYVSNRVRTDGLDFTVKKAKYVR